MFAFYEQKHRLWLYTCEKEHGCICVFMGSSYTVDIPLLPQLLCRPFPYYRSSSCHTAGKAVSCHSCVNMQLPADI